MDVRLASKLSVALRFHVRDTCIAMLFYWNTEVYLKTSTDKILHFENVTALLMWKKSFCRYPV